MVPKIRGGGNYASKYGMQYSATQVQFLSWNY